MRDAVRIGGEIVSPGTLERLEIPVARLPSHTMLHLPVTVVNGVGDGARLWLSAALHGDELNGMEIIREALEEIDPSTMSGLLLAVPVVNVFGFASQSRYLPDRRDLNRCFPGTSRGSLASRLAWLFMKEVVAHCTHGIDLHTAAPPRTNLPQIRADLADEETHRCARAFGAPIMMRGKPPSGALRGAAAKRGAAVLLYEAGEPLRFNPKAIDIGVRGVLSVMHELAMLEELPFERPPASPEASRTSWIRAPQSGVLHLSVKLGESVQVRESIGRITDPFGESSRDIRAPFAGLVIGHALNPLVHRGDGILHLAER